MVALLITATLLGIRHALDPDHLIAVSTLATEERRSWPAAKLGLIWGLGHMLPIGVLGLLLLLLQMRLNDSIGNALELVVGVILVALGIRTLMRFRKEQIHIHVHSHQDGEHIHFHRHHSSEKNRSLGHAEHDHSTHSHAEPARRGLLTFATGVIHGLAGSGAAAVLASSAAPNPFAGILYLLLFGIGNAVGMLFITFAITTPLILASTRFASLHGTIRVLAGVASIAIGAVLWVQILPELLA